MSAFFVIISLSIRCIQYFIHLLDRKTTMTSFVQTPWFDRICLRICLMALTQQFLHFVLFGQGLYLGKERHVARQGGPAEKQSEGFGAGERLWVEGEPLSLFVYIESRPAMLQYGAESLQKQTELSSLQTQPGRRRSNKQ